jgi:hypothetical protein
MSKDEPVFPKKYDKKLPENYKENMETKNTDELKQEILKASGVIVDLELDMENDAKLTALKEDLKALSGGYKDELATEKAKVNYCLFVMRQRGIR